ncbi:AraC family transcriptional regulator [Nonomuraea sp. B12E4]|uniref:AraC family transcriptional regulator n=1 Tax=Nonomuraea sp. B12E4 TaxID=3153564 RepID=UPI00325D55A2
MDAFADLLRGIRANGSVFGHSILSPPWSLRFVDGAPLTLCGLLRGEGWIMAEAQAPRRITVGEAVVVRGPQPFLFVDDPATNAPVVTDCGEHGALPANGGTVHHLGRRTSGDPDASTTLIVGAYPVRGDIGRRLLKALPPVLTVSMDGDTAAVSEYIAAEVALNRPGQQVVLDRLLDWLLVCTLRAWFDHPDTSAPAWYTAMSDPIVGEALRHMHDDPARPWTVAQLASRAGVSRSAFARRFTTLVGQPPLAYLTQWRMTIASDLLIEPDATIADVAKRVGYADAFNFSAAFKRVKGMSPSNHRSQHTRPVASTHSSLSPGDMPG